MPLNIDIQLYDHLKIHLIFFLQEVDLIREQIQKLVSLPIWSNILPVLQKLSLSFYMYLFLLTILKLQIACLLVHCKTINFSTVYFISTVDNIYIYFSKQGKRDEIFKNNPKYKKFFNLIKKNDAKLSEEQMKRVTFERSFLCDMIKKFLGVLDTIPLKGKYFCLNDRVTEKVIVTILINPLTLWA